MGASFRVLVPTRGSLPALRACRLAAEMLSPGGAEVRLFTATERSPSDAAQPATVPADTAAELTRVFERAGHAVAAHARVGDAPAEIVREIDTWSPDLVVMGRWRARTMERWLHGAVFDRVIRHVHVPVLVVTYDPEQEGESAADAYDGPHTADGDDERAQVLRVLVPTRGSEWAIRASRLAARMLAPGRAEVRLLTVLPDEVYPMPYTLEGKRQEDLPERVLRVREAAEVAVAGTRSVFEQAGHAVGAHHRFGHPPAEILGEIDDWAPDLVVLGRWRGVSAPEWVPGSIFERVLRHTRVPVLVAK
jgi:nucleotide-binding universal stress UspA family protein